MQRSSASLILHSQRVITLCIPVNTALREWFEQYAQRTRAVLGAEIWRQLR